MLTPPREIHQYGRIIYQSKQNLSGKDYFVKRNLFGEVSGRYCPETGHDWKKTAKNGLFLEVFGIFDPLPDKPFIPNFKRR